MWPKCQTARAAAQVSTKMPTMTNLYQHVNSPEARLSLDPNLLDHGGQALLHECAERLL